MFSLLIKWKRTFITPTSQANYYLINIQNCNYIIKIYSAVESHTTVKNPVNITLSLRFILLSATNPKTPIVPHGFEVFQSQFAFFALCSPQLFMYFPPRNVNRIRFWAPYFSGSGQLWNSPWSMHSFAHQPPAYIFNARKGHPR